MAPPSQHRVVLTLGLAQTLAWASTYYLPAMLAAPMAADLGLATPTVFAAFSLALGVAALVGPNVGQAMDRWGGRAILAATSVLFAASLVALGHAQGLWSLLLAWCGLGLGIASGLYEAAFATVVRLYGQQARKAITGITLLAGFASTVGWPLTHWMQLHWGWRSTCWVWAGVHLVLCLPLYLSLPSDRQAPTPAPAPTAGPDGAPRPRLDLRTGLLALVFATSGFISSAMAAHLPALVNARLATVLHPVGAALLLLLGPPGALLFGVLHGAGNGMLTIARGTLPLQLFGPQGYGHRQGLLQGPARVAQALAPWLFGVALAQWQGQALWLSGALGLLSVAALLVLSRHMAKG
ncbi:hypothetical protein MA05_06835 [Comamonas aquatica]|uniref:MFS transporter n=1 Tax=Comamonas aquatica TaxID=225991 RepID=UPI0005ED3883|nr:MFS transporter [Comamonas aquatica]ANY61865.1 hypothetical protein MA05_06835 [Comamonas aquatica]